MCEINYISGQRGFEYKPIKEMQEFTPSVIRIVGRSGFADEIAMVQAMRSDFTPAVRSPVTHGQNVYADGSHREMA